MKMAAETDFRLESKLESYLSPRAALAMGGLPYLTWRGRDYRPNFQGIADLGVSGRKWRKW